MNKQDLLYAIAKSVNKKHPWKTSQEKYLNLFKEYPKEFLNERIFYDNLVEKAKQFKLCELILSDIRIEIKLTLDELIVFELSLDKWEDAKIHDILPNDIKKVLKEKFK
jgi:hypothetical protein